MKIIFIMIMITHGLIHFMGFSKAFEYGNITQLTREISRPMGLLWSVTGLLFIVTTILLLLKTEEWWIFGLIAVIISQLLILTAWHDAMFGTIANVIIAVAAILSWGTTSFENSFQNDVKENLRRTNSISTEILTDSDLKAIPEPVQRYLRYAGVVNKTETVTLFNDMCLLAPATLIDKRIEWHEIDSTTTRATFTNKGISINAVLYFNSQGQLIDFKSEDRTAIADMKQYPFSTPVSEYKNTNGINILSRAEVVWHYPDGKFTYGKFTLKTIQNNVSE